MSHLWCVDELKKEIECETLVTNPAARNAENAT